MGNSYNYLCGNRIINYIIKMEEFNKITRKYLSEIEPLIPEIMYKNIVFCFKQNRAIYFKQNTNMKVNSNSKPLKY